jgi:hypothetical protein
MWLINVETRKLEEFIGSADKIPRYAALSHTWENGQEVSFQEYGQFPAGGDKTGYMKIAMTCRQAARDGLQYAWVDTCCIDKSSSAELSEAINSMFNWYKRSTQCYVYLGDLSNNPDPGFDEEEIRHCVWFTRGWTLQELIAPSEVKFYNHDWTLVSRNRAPAYNYPLLQAWTLILSTMISHYIHCQWHRRCLGRHHEELHESRI